MLSVTIGKILKMVWFYLNQNIIHIYVVYNSTNIQYNLKAHVNNSTLFLKLKNIFHFKLCEYK